MRKNMIAAGLLALAGFAASASAQSPGDIVFTVDDFFSNQPQGIYSLSVGQQLAPVGGQVPTQRLLFAEGANRVQGITWDGAGTYYVADGVLPTQNPSTAKIWRVNNMFGAPVATNISEGGQLENPIGVAFHAASNNIITVNNTIAGGPGPGFEGIVGVNASTGVRTTLFQENNANPRPRHEGGTYISQSPQAAFSNTFYAVSVNGGVAQPNPSSDDGVASVITRFDVNPGSLATTATTLVDMTDVQAALGGVLLTQLRGIAAIPGTNSLLITDLGNKELGSPVRAGGIYRIDLNGSGGFSSISPVITGLAFPESIVYNPFTGKIVFEEIVDLNTPGVARISQVNLNGTGLQVIADGIHARGFVVVPAPTSAMALAGAGLVALRRRRR
jgi:hypothetical protein